LFTKEIEVLKKLIEKAGISAETVCGSTPKKLRKERLRTPEKVEDGPEVLIVQIQTACEGLNLQHINEIYFTTPHWNPSVEDQAIARAHRIGQEKEVDVYRFVSKFQNKKDDTSITLDEYCMTVQEKKREIAKSIFAQ
jgi:SWI/SNF-related matrix-associated actin-dependent regulator of chromatin subfamily A3